MKPIAADWIAKAEADFASVERECRARTRTNYDAACFHAQQCVEKYLKSRLAQAGATITRTHDLVSLLETVKRLEPLWEPFLEDLAFLTDFAVTYRYPGDSATKETAMDALRRCRRFRGVARAALGLEERPGAARFRTLRKGNKGSQ